MSMQTPAGPGGGNQINRALRRVAVAVLVMFLLLLANVNSVQAFQAGSLANDPGNSRTFDQQFQYQRGAIVTSDGVTIAESRRVGHVYQRYYPKGAAFAPVTGYDSIYSPGPVSPAGQPEGIEPAENRYLSGTDSQLTVSNVVDLLTGKPRKGATVQVTINSAAQEAAYQALKATHLSGAAVAIDPATGAILAMASYPTFNPNALATLDGAALNKADLAYLHDPKNPLINRAIQQTYPPGSTFKVVTASTAFSTGRYSPTTRYPAPTNLSLPDTSVKLINYDNGPCFDPANPTGGNGTASLIAAFAESCNTVYGALGMHLGGAALHSMAGRFGLNNPNLSIPLGVAESRYPLISNPDYTAYSAIGQYDDQVTPLQVAMFAATIANHGTLMKPYLVKQIGPDYSPVQVTSPTVLSKVESPQVAAQVGQMMAAVVSQWYGTAYHTSRLPNIQIAAKTGTAQNGVGNSGADDAVYTAFAPYKTPQIAVGVVIAHGGFGADASAPVAVKIIQAYMGYLAAQAKR